MISHDGRGSNPSSRIWKMLSIGSAVLAAASLLLFIWELTDDGWSRVTVAFICNVVTFFCLSLIARARSWAA